MSKYSLSDIESFFPKDISIEKPDEDKESFFSDIKTLGDAHENSLVFVDHLRKDKQELIESCKANIIICDFDIQKSESLKSKTLIRVKNPKLTFSQIGNALFVNRPSFGIHPSAVVDPSATIHEDVYIGPNAFIGPNCTIDQGTYIYAGAVLYQDIVLGKNVIIKAGAYLGGDGYGYNKDENGFPIQFPHIGSVILEDFVEVGSASCIDRGALGPTKIEFGTKIDNLVHIGHNVNIGRQVYIAAQTTIGGSSRIEDDVEIWMGVKVMDGTRIGKKASIGMGSVVIRNVKAEKKVFGNPGREF